MPVLSLVTAERAGTGRSSWIWAIRVLSMWLSVDLVVVESVVFVDLVLG
jgi:hypothetical protein